MSIKLPSTTLQRHEYFMARALTLAAKGAGWTSPNPLVGCVIVKNSKVIASGYHRRYGQAHAEIDALTQLTAPNKKHKSLLTHPALPHNLRGATIYVTLEPCVHYGQTPPCVTAIIQSGIKQAVIATLDPNPIIHGRGIRALRVAGISTIVGVLAKPAQYQNRLFFYWVQKHKLYVCVKVAVSQDNKITKESGIRTKISSATADLFTQNLRQCFDAVLVGAQTVIIDNPRLTARGRVHSDQKRHQPIPIILDGRLRLPLSARLLQNPQTIVATTAKAPTTKLRATQKKVNVLILPDHLGHLAWHDFLTALNKRGITNLLVEGGQQILTQVLAAQVVQEWIMVRAPQKFNAGLDFVEQPQKFNQKFRLRAKYQCGRDTLEFYYPKNSYGTKISTPSPRFPGFPLVATAFFR